MIIMLPLTASCQLSASTNYHHVHLATILQRKVSKVCSNDGPVSLLEGYTSDNGGKVFKVITSTSSNVE